MRGKNYGKTIKRTLPALMLLIATALYGSSSDTSKDTVVAVPIDDVRTAARIFEEHKWLLEERRLLLRINESQERRFAGMARIDSAKTVRITVQNGEIEKYRRKAGRRMKWLVAASALCGLLLILKL